MLDSPPFLLDILRSRVVRPMTTRSHTSKAYRVRTLIFRIKKNALVFLRWE